MKDFLIKTPGRLLATALNGAWRSGTYAQKDAAVTCSLDEAELCRLVPLLTGAGCAPLGWWTLRHTPYRNSAPVLQLKEIYRYHTIQAALSERQIARLFTLLREARVEAVLVKGYAAARLYEERGLRPYGDIDVCVAHAQYDAASRVLDSAEAKQFWVDLHRGMGEEEREPPAFAELYARGETLSVGGDNHNDSSVTTGVDATRADDASSASAAATAVRVLSAEDHLRLLCLHLLKHGAWRPLWLCDVAAAIEGRASNFDWERVTGKDARRARWIACAIGLAHELLGARLDDTPFEREDARRLPRWLVPEVLKQWATPYAVMQAPLRYRAPMRAYLRRPSGVFADLQNRWPNPIEATVHTGGSFNELPRWPFQVANCITRAARFVGGARHAATH